MNTTTNRETHILRAKYVLPVPGESIENGALVTAGSKIVEVGRWGVCGTGAQGEVRDFGNCAIIPGLVNAHTHLELTDLRGRIPPQEKFTDWIGKLVRARLLWSKRKFYASVKRGIAQSLACGTTTVCDITNSGQAFRALSNAQIRSVVFQELIGTDPSKASHLAEEVEKDLTKIDTKGLMQAGISPHAPYTVSNELYRECQTVADSLNCPISTHLSETLSEVEFLQNGSGELFDFIRRFRMLPVDWKPPGLSPAAHLNGLCKLSGRWLLAHCNYLSDGDVEIIELTGANVVLCPRSHAYFGHSEHPFAELLNMGVNVALGTDSLASNESLSVLDEMKFLATDGGGISPELVFRLATQNGAQAVGMESYIGSLLVGKEADIAVVRLPEDSSGSPFEELLDGSARNIFTMVAGRIAWRDS